MCKDHTDFGLKPPKIWINTQLTGIPLMYKYMYSKCESQPLKVPSMCQKGWPRKALIPRFPTFRCQLLQIPGWNMRIQPIPPTNCTSSQSWTPVKICEDRDLKPPESLKLYSSVGWFSSWPSSVLENHPGQHRITCKFWGLFWVKIIPTGPSWWGHCDIPMSQIRGQRCGTSTPPRFTCVNCPWNLNEWGRFLHVMSRRFVNLVGIVQ